MAIKHQKEFKLSDGDTIYTNMSEHCRVLTATGCVLKLGPRKQHSFVVYYDMKQQLLNVMDK
jgi:hypothetical protein